MNSLHSFRQSFDSCSSDSKSSNMKLFIKATSEYIKTKSEEFASAINRHLQLLSITIDYSIFDPNTSVVSEFFVSLHELLNTLEPRSSLAWCCVNVLNVACKNSSARHQLIHVYQFVPLLSRLLGDHLTTDKKVRLLTLMQELSCGLKMSWVIPNLSYLISTLTRWIVQRNESEQVIMLSLGVLVNLCYKNLPAIYTLSRCIEIKTLIRTCSTLKDVIMEVNVCKLLIILDYIHGTVPEEAVLKLVGITFKSVREAFEAKDPILLRHIVEFYLDVVQHNEHAEVNSQRIIAKCGDYHVKVEELIYVIDNNASTAAGDSSHQDPECMALIFKFLHSLIELKLPHLTKLHPKLIELTLRWVQTELVQSEALNILRTIVTSPERKDDHILESLLKSVPVFLVGLDTFEEDVIMNIEQCKRLSAIMQLLTALVQAPNMRERVMSSLNEVTICKIFLPLIGNNSPRSRAPEANNCTPEAVCLYVNTLVLVNELARYSLQWVSPLTTLLQHREMHAILAEALYSGSKEIKSMILTIATSPQFPCLEIAGEMYELQPLVNKEVQPTNNLMCFPMMSVQQSDRLDDMIQKLRDSYNQNGTNNISMSDVMELYEYRLSSMGHAERAAMASVEAASQRCIHLQHQLAQLTAEISRIRQLFIHTQQCNEELHKSNGGLEKEIGQLRNQLVAEKGNSKVRQSMLEQKERLLQEKEGQVEDLSKQLKEIRSEKNTLEENHKSLKIVAQKLEENLKRQEKNSEKKDEIIKKANANSEHFQAKIVQKEMHLKQLEMELKTCREELNRCSSELTQKTEIIETITRLANGRRQ